MNFGEFLYIYGTLYSTNSVLTRFPINEWKDIRIKLKNTSKRQWSGWSMEYKIKRTPFKKVDLVEFGFFQKNGRSTKTFDTFLEISKNPDKVFYLYTLRDKIGEATFQKRIQRVNDLFKNYFKLSDVNPITKSKAEGDYINRIAVDVQYQSSQKIIDIYEQKKFQEYEDGVTKIAPVYDDYGEPIQ